MKKLFVTCILMLLLLCGCGHKTMSKDVLLNPRAVTTTDDDVFYYGDTKETVEEIVGTNSKLVLTGMKNYLKYNDDINVLYREDGGEERAVLFIIDMQQYSTYQGIHVGDKWSDVEGKLKNVASKGNGRLIAFDGDISVDPLSVEKADDWFMISYILEDDGTIENISLYDVQAGASCK